MLHHSACRNRPFTSPAHDRVGGVVDKGCTSWHAHHQVVRRPRGAQHRAAHDKATGQDRHGARGWEKQMGTGKTSSNSSHLHNRQHCPQQDRNQTLSQGIGVSQRHAPMPLSASRHTGHDASTWSSLLRKCSLYRGTPSLGATSRCEM